MKMDNFACIKILVFSMIGSLGHKKSYFRGVHFICNGFLRNANYAKICTAQKYYSTFTVPENDPWEPAMSFMLHL